jgi:outer membrane protein TolC
MKRLYQILLGLVMLPALSVAQSPNRTPATASQSFTLEQCIQYALENSYDIKNATLDQKIADAKVKETRGIGFPQISGSAAVQHYNDLPRMFMTKESVYNFASPKDEAGNPIALQDWMPEVANNSVFANQNLFQLKNSGTAGFEATQILFNGSYLVGLQAAKAYKNLSAKAFNQTKETTIQQVTKAFYGVLINKDRIELFNNNIARVESLLNNTKALNENGFAEAIDVDRIRVAFNNLKSEKGNFENLQELSVLLLKFQMNYPMDQEIDVVGDIASLRVDEDVLKNYTTEWDYAKRTDYQLLLANERLKELNLKNIHAGSLPTLAAFGNYGWQTQSSTFGGIFKTETNIAGFEDKWYPVSYLGLSLSVPIFTGLQQTYRVQQAKIEVLKTQNSITRAKQGIDLEVKQTALTYLNAVNTLKSQDENRALAENVARVTKIKYEQGVGSNIEVITAESSLREAQVNYYSALYDALVAKVDLDKAYGKLVPTTTENK